MELVIVTRRPSVVFAKCLQQCDAVNDHPTRGVRNKFTVSGRRIEINLPMFRAQFAIDRSDPKPALGCILDLDR